MLSFEAVRPKVLVGLIACVAVLGAPRVALAAADPHPAEQIVRGLVSEVATIIAGAEGARGEALSQALVPALEARTDIALIGRLALGAHWRRAAPEDRQEYQALFHDFMLTSLANHLRPHVGASMDAYDTFNIRSVRPAGRRDVLVATTINPPGRPPLEVGWRLRERDGHYVIIDLVVEGVSLLVTQRADFSAVIERAGLTGLLKELRARSGAST